MRTENYNNLIGILLKKGRFNNRSKNLDILEELPVAIYTCDTQGKITFYNTAAVELWGRKPRPGKDFWCGSWKLYQEDGTLLPQDQCAMAVVIRKKKEIKAQKIILECPDGTRRHVLPHPKPIFDTTRKIIGAITMLVDISEQVAKDLIIAQSEIKYKKLCELLENKVEQRTLVLKKSEQRYHQMVEEVQDYAILLLDINGNILNWNKGAQKIKGYCEKEILGKNFSIFYLPEDQKNSLPCQLISEASKNGRAMHEGWRVRKNGDTFWGLTVITALHDQEKNIIGFTKVTRDLTERKLAEDLEKEFTRNIAFRNKQLEEYAHIASHDLQEPLRKIQTFIELLERNLDDHIATARHLDKIKTAAKRMTILIQDVLHYSQLSLTDNLFVPTDLNTILENIKEDYELLIAQKKATIIQSILPVVTGIPIQLQQLFSNLFANSLKFSKDDLVIEITIEKVSSQDITNLDLDQTKEYIKIIFKDNGIGFNSLYADQVFKLFRKLHPDQTGTGVGLALCRKIVENHKGHINVTSVIDSGTTFQILLPKTH